jgi:hypothetical protein
MTEAWLLIEASAIRAAAGNPNGTVPLVLPKRTELESLPDPKRVLRDLLVVASEFHGRRRAQFDVAGAASRVARLIEDYAPLRALQAFKELERDLAETWPSVTASVGCP